MKGIQHLRLWENTTGVTVSNAGNVFLETNGGARTGWVQKGNWPAGVHISGQAGPAINNTVDTLRGYPFWHREHVMSLEVGSADRCFIEWRGQVTAASGFALGGGGLPTSVARAYWFSREFAVAFGTFEYDPSVTFRGEPGNVCYNVNQLGKNASVMAGNDQNTNLDPAVIHPSFRLLTRSFIGHAQDTTNNDWRQVHRSSIGISKIPFDNAVNVMSDQARGGVMWGYTQRDSSVDNSRYPQAGDQLGFIFEIGYPDIDSYGSQVIQNTATPQNMVPVTGPLRVSGLARIWFSIYTTCPATKAAPYWLDFDTVGASLTVIGSVTAHLVSL